MTDYHVLVPIPARTDINTGLTAAKPSTMRGLFGVPGALTRDCSRVKDSLNAQMTSANIGPFSVTGWKPAVASLQAIFAEVHATEPALFAVVRSAGMLCCRAVRGSQSNFSNHSWGTAIDLKIETQLDEMGANKVQRGILLLYPYFRKHGWFWGAGYSSRKDPMHWELADTTVRRMYKEMHG